MIFFLVVVGSALAVGLWARISALESHLADLVERLARLEEWRADVLARAEAAPKSAKPTKAAPPSAPRPTVVTEPSHGAAVASSPAAAPHVEPTAVPPRSVPH